MFSALYAIARPSISSSTVQRAPDVQVLVSHVCDETGPIAHSSKIRFLRFQNPKTRLFTFFEVLCLRKNVKKAERVIQVSFQSTAVSTLLHFEIADTFAVKQLHTIIQTTYTVSGKNGP